MAYTTGGGATHIATATGDLRTLKTTSNLIIASGGGGGGYFSNGSAVAGADAGGATGSGSYSGNQSTGYMFGQGEYGTAGGGGGLYGGRVQAGAGSGYIANNNLSNKKMVGYNVPTSSTASSLTESTDQYSVNAVSGLPKSGNGFAKIKLLREV